VKKILLCVVGLIAWIPASPALAEKKYGPGVTDTEIKIGQTMPYSGPVSAYGTIGKTEVAYFKMVNDRGGINGRKINLISLDDGYSPPKTIEQVRKLVEQEEVFALFQTLGTAPNNAIVKYTNSKQVPNIFIGAIAEKLGDAEAYPWTLPWNPTGVLEGTQQAHWLIKERPKAKIALLYQNDDLGKDFARGIKIGLGNQAAKAVVAEATYEVTDPAIDSQIITLQGSGADVLVMAGTPKFGAQAIRKVYDMNWRPLFIVSNTLSAIESTLKPAGLDKAIGLISASYFKADPEQWSNDPAMQDYLSMMQRYYPDGNANDGTNVYGYIAAMAFHEVLRRCGDDLTRENLMRQATSLKNVAQPMLLDGVTLNTSPTNHHPIGKMYPVRFDGKHWKLLNDAVDK
jgi:ABC-type branched-subunit amino acid transport system substrate-binding protein